MSILDYTKISQDIQTRVKRLTKANVKGYLEEKIKLLSLPKLNDLDLVQGIISATEYYQLSDQTIKPKTKINFLHLALLSFDKLIIADRAFAVHKRNLLIHIGNFYISQSQFFEAAHYFENALINEKDDTRKAIVFINVARCKLWLRDFSGVFSIVKKASTLSIADPVLQAYLEVVRARFLLLIGDYHKSGQMLRAILTNLDQSTVPLNLLIEIQYLETVVAIMANWKYRWIDQLKFFHAKITQKISPESLHFYQLEESLFKIFYLLAKRKTPTTVLTRKISSLRRKATDPQLTELSSTVVKFCSGTTKSDLDYRKVSVGLRALLLGAHDFTYQFLNVLWLDILWTNNQKTEFARTEIEFRAYFENIKNEIGGVIDPNLWLATELTRMQNLKKQIKSVNSYADFLNTSGS